MTSSLLDRAYKLNQHINNLIFPTYFVSFDSHKNCWKYNGTLETSKTASFYLLIVIIICFFIITSVITFSEIYHPSYLDTEEVLSTFVAIFTTVDGITIHLSLAYFGQDYIFAVNETLRLYRKQLTYELHNARNNREKWRILQNRQLELHKVGKGTMFLLLLEMALLTAMPIASVAYNIDPLYSFFKILGIYYPNYFSSLNSILIVSRALVSILYVHVVYMGPRIYHILMQSSGPLWMNVVESLLSANKPNIALLELYRQQCIVVKNCAPAQISTSSISLSTYFLLLVFGVNAVLTWISAEECVLAVGGAIYMGYVFFNVMSSINLACKLYRVTDNLLKNWRSRLGLSKYVRLVLRSFCKMTSPAGSMGVIDNDMKLHYLDNLVNYVVNVLMMT